MKKIVCLAAMMLCYALMYAQSVQVSLTTSSTLPGWQPNDPLPTCAGTNLLRVAVVNNSGSSTGAFTLALVPNQLLTFGIGTVSCGSVQIATDTVKYTFTNIVSGDSCVATLEMFIPCTVTGPLSIAKSILPGSPVTISNNAASPISYKQPKMLVDSFRSAAGVLLGANTVQPLILTPETNRSFVLMVSDGRVDEFDFNYIPEHEIEWDRFEVQAFTGGSPVGSPVVYDSTNPVPHFNGSLINSFFGRPYMIIGDRLKFTEYFRIDTCSQLTDKTKYTVTWYCPNQTPNDCNARTEERRIDVNESEGYPRLIWQPLSAPFQVCGDTTAPNSSTDITYRITNFLSSGTDVTGSGISSVHIMRFPIDTSWFTYQQIRLISDQNEVVTTWPAGFLSFSNGDCILNFDTLSSPLFQNNSPVVDTFLKDNIFNELITGRYFELQFVNTAFHCKGNSGTKTLFNDCKNSSETPMFFAQSYYDGFISYSKMCTDSLSYALNMNTINYRHYTETLLETDKTDLETQETATLDYHFAIQTNPFASTANIIVCDSVRYFPSIEVSPKYTLDSVHYFQHPNDTVSTAIIPLFTGMTSTGDSIFRLQADSMSVSFSGRLLAYVRLSNCPYATGGLDTIRIRHYAVCDSCYDCAFTLKCNEVALYRHCQGPCDGPAANTSSFTFNRASLGWQDSVMNQLVDTSLTNISYNRSYPCDSIIVQAEGSVAQTNYVVDSIYFRINYNNSVNNKLFEFVSGYYLVYDSVTNQTTNVTINTSDLVGNWNSNCTSCQLKFNFPPGINQDSLLLHKGSVKLFAVLKVRNDILQPVGSSYNHNLQQIRGQFISVYNGNTVQESCDSWGDNMLVMNVNTIWNERMTAAGQAAVLKDQNWATEALNYPSYHTLCERRFTITTQVVGGFNFFDDFPNEFRPITLWPDVTKGDTLSFALPSNLSFGAANFRANTYHTNWWPVNTINNGNVLKFTGINNGGWPVIDHDGTHQVTFWLTGQLNNVCPPNFYQADTVVTPDSAIVHFPHSRRAYAKEAPCAAKDTAHYRSVYSTVKYSLEMKTQVDTFKVYSMNDSLSNITMQFYDSTGSFNPRIPNAWIYPLSNPYCTVTGIMRGNNLLTQSNGFFQVGTLDNKVLNNIQVNISIQSCVPDVPFVLQLVYGYNCGGYPTSITNAGSCRRDTINLLILPKKSGMSLGLSAPVNNTVAVCDTITYTATLTSNDLADAEQPSLVVTPPAGLSMVAATCTTNSAAYPGGNLVIAPGATSDTLYLNNQVYYGNGMPGGGHVATITMHFVPLCTAVTGSYGINFNASALNICSSSILVQNDSLTSTVNIQNNLLPLQADVFATHSFTGCDSPLVVTIHADNIQYNGSAVIQGTVALPPGFVLTGASIPVTGTNPVSWSQQPVTGSSFSAVLQYTIPAGFCGLIPVQSTILLNDSLHCSGNVNCLDSLLIIRTDSLNVCCDTCNLDISATVTHVTCEYPPNGAITLVVNNGNAPYTYAWAGGQTTATIANLMPGIYSCVVTDSLGCTDSITVTVQDYDSLQVSITPQDTLVCINTPVTLTATGCSGCTYYWYPGGETTQSIVVTPSYNTQYYVEIFTAGGCVYKLEATVKVQECESNTNCMYVYNQEYKDEGKDIERTSDDGYVLVGSMYRGDGDLDAYMVKYDQDLNMQFAKRIGEGTQLTEWRNEKANAVIQDGNYFYFTGEVKISSTNTDVYVVKTDLNGNIIWANRYGDKKEEVGTGIHMLPCGSQCGGGELIVTGYSNDRNGGQAFNYMAMKINASNGALIKIRTYGVEKTYYGKSHASVLLNDRRHIVMTGECAREMNVQDRYILCLKINDDLTVTQSNIIENEYADNIGYNIIQKGKTLYVTGTTNAFGDRTYDIYLLALDENTLTVQNSRVYGYRETDEMGYGLRLSADEELSVTAVTQSEPNAIPSDALILKLDAGTLDALWKNRITHEYNQALYSITASASAGYAVAGIWGLSDTDEEIFVSLLDSTGRGCCYEPIELDDHTGYKDWRPRITEIKPVFSIKQDIERKDYYDYKMICGEIGGHTYLRPGHQHQLATLNAVALYPNPANQQFTVTTGKIYEDVNIRVIDLQGRVMLQRRFINNRAQKFDISAAALQEGMYIVEMNTTGGKWVGKLLIGR